MPPTVPATAPPQGRRQAGFSLLETLIAAALLMLILIGILPLFERSRMNLLQGYDASRVSNAATENFEQLLALPFLSFDTNLPDGADRGTRTDFWLLEGDRWAAAVPVGDRAQFQRFTTIDQFGVSSVVDDDEDLFDAGTELPGGTVAADIHYKRLTTDIVNPRVDGPGGTYRIVTIHTY